MRRILKDNFRKTQMKFIVKLAVTLCMWPRITDCLKIREISLKLNSLAKYLEEITL